MSHQDSREKSISRFACLVALSLIFTKEVCSEGLFPTQENEVLKWSKHCSAWKGSPPAPIQILTHPPLSLIETAIFVNSHLKKWEKLFSLSKGILLVVQAMNLLKLLNFLNFLILQGRKAPSTLHICAHFAIGLQWVFKLAPMPNYSRLSLNLLRLEHQYLGTFSVPVYYLLWVDLKCDLPFCTSHNILILVLVLVGL